MFSLVALISFVVETNPERWIDELGHSEYEIRTRAFENLLMFPLFSLRPIQERLKSPEVKQDMERYLSLKTLERRLIHLTWKYDVDLEFIKSTRTFEHTVGKDPSILHLIKVNVKLKWEETADQFIGLRFPNSSKARSLGETYLCRNKTYSYKRGWHTANRRNWYSTNPNNTYPYRLMTFEIAPIPTSHSEVQITVPIQFLGLGGRIYQKLPLVHEFPYYGEEGLKIWKLENDPKKGVVVVTWSRDWFWLYPDDLNFVGYNWGLHVGDLVVTSDSRSEVTKEGYVATKLTYPTRGIESVAIPKPSHLVFSYPKFRRVRNETHRVTAEIPKAQFK